MDVTTLRYLLKKAEKRKKETNPNESDEDIHDYFLQLGGKKKKQKLSSRKKEEGQMRKLMKQAKILINEQLTP